MPLKKRYDSAFKVQVVLESLNPNTTIESVKNKYKLSNNALNNWRRMFFKNASKVFETKSQTSEDVNVDELKRIIADLTIQVEVLKKASIYMH